MSLLHFKREIVKGNITWRYVNVHECIHSLKLKKATNVSFSWTFMNCCYFTESSWTEGPNTWQLGSVMCNPFFIKSSSGWKRWMLSPAEEEEYSHGLLRLQRWALTCHCLTSGQTPALCSVVQSLLKANPVCCCRLSLQGGKWNLLCSQTALHRCWSWYASLIAAVLSHSCHPHPCWSSRK